MFSMKSRLNTISSHSYFVPAVAFGFVVFARDKTIHSPSPSGIFHATCCLLRRRHLNMQQWTITPPVGGVPPEYHINYPPNHIDGSHAASHYPQPPPDMTRRDPQLEHYRYGAQPQQSPSQQQGQQPSQQGQHHAVPPGQQSMSHAPPPQAPVAQQQTPTQAPAPSPAPRQPTNMPLSSKRIRITFNTRTRTSSCSSTNSNSSNSNSSNPPRRRSMHSKRLCSTISSSTCRSMPNRLRPRWAEIAKTFPNRTEGSVKKHWYKDMHYAEFAEDESQALMNAIKEYENNKWKSIGNKVGKPAKACEQYAKEHFPELFATPKRT
ncbi:hypothetical protein P8C59_002735 [Phyllachora maydis]|uniref:Myb-like domain-containing protein n=1 Tax=Phyllachora maydis TaxID=1825666 RepID=A0AAD9HZZ9_9PEZI|nr:hypothetical protein P8C59_002735 [Phyllachora maydis]